MEQWKQFLDLNDYEISNGGRVRNIRTGKMRKVNPNGHGYLCITINHKNYRIHKVVAQTFVYNPNKTNLVMHLDGNKKNNHHTNLKWGTHSENLIQAYRTKERVDAKLEGKWDYIVDKYKANSHIRGTIANLARELSCDRKAIYQVLKKNGITF